MRQLRERGAHRVRTDGGALGVCEAADPEKAEAEQEARGGRACQQPADAGGHGTDAQ